MITTTPEPKPFDPTITTAVIHQPQPRRLPVEAVLSVTVRGRIVGAVAERNEAVFTKRLHLEFEQLDDAYRTITGLKAALRCSMDATNLIIPEWLMCLHGDKADQTVWSRDRDPEFATFNERFK